MLKLHWGPMLGLCISGLPKAGGRSHRQAQVCSLGPLQSFLHAVCPRWWGEFTKVYLNGCTHNCCTSGSLRLNLNSGTGSKHIWKMQFCSSVLSKMEFDQCLHSWPVKLQRDSWVLISTGTGSCFKIRPTRRWGKCWNNATSQQTTTISLDWKAQGRGLQVRCQSQPHMTSHFQSTRSQKATLSLASQMSSLPFHFTEPILFESCFQAEMSRSANGQTRFAERDDLIRRSEIIFLWGRNQNGMT